MKLEIELPDRLFKELENLRVEILEIKANLKPKESNIYLSRSEVSTMLSIDISSVHNWTKKGILTAYQIGGRVYYKRSEVEAAIIELKK